MSGHGLNSPETRNKRTTRTKPKGSIPFGLHGTINYLS